LLVDRYNAKAWYAEDLTDKYQLNPSHFRYGQRQWLKFDYALNQALEWEEANGAKFEFIHRIRTDVTFPDKFHELMVQPLENKDINSICMLNVHDFCFSARRNALPFLLKLASFSQDFRHDDAKLANILKFINIDQLKHTDIHSTCYLHSFQVGILAVNQNLVEFGLLLKEKYTSHPSSHSFIEAAAAFASSLNDYQYMSHVLNLAHKPSCLIRTWNNTQCYLLFSEIVLARFYNFFGIYTYRYAVGIRLKTSRQANSDFTFNILQMIDNDDVSFLSDTEIDWDKENTDFLEKGGNGGKLCRIFTDLTFKHYSKLAAYDHNRLEVIFEIFARKCTFDMEFFLNEKFKSFAFEKGIKLPLTDFYECARSARDLTALKRFGEAQAKIQEGLNKMPNQINLLMTASDVSRASGNLEKSLEYAESLIIHHPSNWNGYYKSAQDLISLKRFDEAQAKVQEGLGKMPSQINLLMIAIDILRASDNRKKSLEHAENLIIHHPGDWSGYGKSAEDLIALKRFDEAQAKVQKGLDEIPHQTNLLPIANDIYRALGNREKSLEYAKSLIMHNPGNWNGYCRSAQDLMALKRLDEAQVKVKDGLDKIPNQISLLVTASDIYRGLGNREKSLKFAQNLIIHHPSIWHGYGKSAEDLLALKRFDEAQAKIKDGLDRIPNQVSLLMIASDIHRVSGNREKSLEYAESLIIHAPGNWYGYSKSAEDLMTLKRFDEARARIKQGLDRVPNQPSLLAIQNDINKILSGP
jgi:tetratricopeptide (TPR) repeat protein